ncbi:hypothetical protein DXA64_07275, partial [Collinsella sp. OF03-4AA]
ADERIAAAELAAGERIEQEVAVVKAAHERELEAARAEMQQRLDALAQELERAERNRERAERRAEGNSLSRYLLARLRGEAGEGVATAPDEDDASAADATEAEVAADPETSAKDDDK